MPCNGGGAKDPDFWCAFDDGEVKVIGDEPDTPEKIRALQRKLYCKAKAEPLSASNACAKRPRRVRCGEAKTGCVTMASVFRRKTGTSCSSLSHDQADRRGHRAWAVDQLRDHHPAARGTIAVDSEVGDFTEFTVRLPRRRHAVA
jgi:uncharacterized protein (DUF3084 family)